MAYKVKITKPNGSFYYQTGFGSKASAESWAKSFKEKGPNSQIKYKVLPEGVVSFKKYMESIEDDKSEALEEYKKAKAKYLANKTDENWKDFVEKKSVCMALGVRI